MFFYVAKLLHPSSHLASTEPKNIVFIQKNFSSISICFGNAMFCSLKHFVHSYALRQHFWICWNPMFDAIDCGQYSANRLLWWTNPCKVRPQACITPTGRWTKTLLGNIAYDPACLPKFLYTWRVLSAVDWVLNCLQEDQCFEDAAAWYAVPVGMTAYVLDSSLVHRRLVHCQTLARRYRKRETDVQFHLCQASLKSGKCI